MGPDYQLARPEFDYWAQHLLKLGAIRDKRDISDPRVGSARMVTKTGQIIETKTADDTRKLAAVAPDGIIMSEAAQQDYDSYLRCVGRIAEKRGWLLMSGTLEGSLGWYAEKYNDWTNPDNNEGGVAYSLPSWSNSFIYPGGRNDPEIKRLESLYSTVEGLFEERIGAVPVPPSTLVFREYRATIHQSTSIRFDPSLPVYLAVDPSSGTNPYAVLACQFHAHYREDLHPDPIDYCHVIDAYYASNRICEDIIPELADREWWGNVRGGAIDVEAPDERKRWFKYGKVTLWSNKVERLAGIRRVKSFLYFKRDDKTGLVTSPPHLMIGPKVKCLPYEMSKFRRDPAKDEDHEPRDEPPKNQADHALTALWYLLIARYGEVKSSYRAQPAYNWHRKGRGHGRGVGTGVAHAP